MGQGDEAATENGSRMAHGDPRPARTPSREQQSSTFFWIFYEEQHVTVIYAVTVFCRVAESYTLYGERPPAIRSDVVLIAVSMLRFVR